MKSTVTAAFAMLAMLSLGCGTPTPEPEETAECFVDTDCDGEHVCRQGICALTESEPRSLGFDLVPPPGSTYPPQTVPVRELEPDEPVQIGLDPGVRVAGQIAWVAEDAGPGSGQLKFKRVRGNDGFTAETAVEDNAYEIFVPAGVYDIAFFPADKERPTHVWSNIDIQLDTDPKLQLVEDVVEIRGTLSRTDATTLESALVQNARVFATSRDTRATSSSAVTDESGEFSIAVPPKSGFYDLHVAPARPNSEAAEDGQYIPDATYERAFEVRDRDWINHLDENEQAASLSVSLGEYGYHSLRIPFRLVAEGLGDLEWEGTTVTLRTSAGRGTISITQRLGDEGMFELPLVLGEYEAIIRTPPNFPVQSVRLPGIAVDESGVELAIGLREEFSGRVEGPGGDALSAQLTFEPIGEDELAEPVTVQTDEDGRYDVYLEDTEYAVSVVPTDSSLPRWIGTAEPERLPAVIQIADPVLVWGSVLGTPTPGAGNNRGDWRELPDVSVRVLERSEGRERIVGEGQTNERGEFKVVIGAR